MSIGKSKISSITTFAILRQIYEITDLLLWKTCQADFSSSHSLIMIPINDSYDQMQIGKRKS